MAAKRGVVSLLQKLPAAAEGVGLWRPQVGTSQLLAGLALLAGAQSWRALPK